MTKYTKCLSKGGWPSPRLLFTTFKYIMTIFTKLIKNGDITLTIRTLTRGEEIRPHCTITACINAMWLPNPVGMLCISIAYTFFFTGRRKPGRWRWRFGHFNVHCFLFLLNLLQIGIDLPLHIKIYLEAKYCVMSNHLSKMKLYLIQTSTDHFPTTILDQVCKEPK